ncbi:MAG: putative selenate reductase subunit YgfK [Clostridia bacterium]
MGDRMRPIPFAELMDWALGEYARSKSLFGVNALYFHASDKVLPIFGESIETPFGPAAGPHTQLAQNLIAAYAGGSRFFELKTVQKLDGEDLPVAKPCILAEDEGYNVEWSTELRVPEAFDEYVKGWFALKLLSRELGLGAPDGFVFNMSVGYDLAGIQSPKIDRFIEGLKQAQTSDIWQECAAWAKANLARFARVDAAFIDSIDSRVCKSITLSTLHGCPPDEIERIATYLIQEKHLNTYVKCNPTLLGYDFARTTLDKMGYDYLVFDDHHFRDDLQYADAVPMFERLLHLAACAGVEFGLKLTNTFPVTIARGELPGEEMYMSGKSLFPLSINLAKRIEHTFGGKLRVSYSGGADYFNVDKIFCSGVWPITMATTLLAPGGYNRLKPMAEKLAALPYQPFAGVDLSKLDALAASAIIDPRHQKPLKLAPSRKLKSEVPLLDCFLAPCSEGCPIHQDIPTYLKLVGEGKYAEALSVICEKNPLPTITGTLCPHTCALKCTRNFYEAPITIRETKLIAAEKGMADYLAALAPANARPEKVAIVGGGPAGMAAAFFLSRAGAQATIFEKRAQLGGIVQHVIPAFRISDSAIARDARLLQKLGVQIHLNTCAPSKDELLSRGFTHIILAVGAWQPGKLALASGEAQNVIEFLESQKDGSAAPLGENVVVIGGGNTAMDAARVAVRAPGVKHLSLVYRRTVRQMPADLEELELALADGVNFLPLLSPVSHEDGRLTCDKMRLGAPDASGRRAPEATGERVQVAADSVIAAVGEKVDAQMLRDYGVALGARGLPEHCENGNLFVVGDALSGPATVVEGIADATRAAYAILGGAPEDSPYAADPAHLKAKRATFAPAGDAAQEATRCLGCSVVCENCVDVCPNRANIEVLVPGMAKAQIVHLDKLCNECGNCAVFCPYASAPYKDKFTFFGSEADFMNSENQGFFSLGEGRVRIRFAGKIYDDTLDARAKTDAHLVSLMATVLRDYAYIR